MGFTWNEDISVGAAIKSTNVTEIRTNVDWIKDNECSAYNAAVQATYYSADCSAHNAGVLTSNNTGVQSSHLTGFYSSHLTVVYSYHKSSVVNCEGRKG